MKSIKLIHIIIILTCLLAMSSCELFLYNDEGELQQESLTYVEFNTLTFYDIFDVELVSDTVFSIEIETLEKYIAAIEVVNDSGNLSFSDYNSLNWLPEYPRPKLRISFPRLDDKIHIAAPVNLYSSDTLFLPQLYITSLGKTGDYNLILNTDVFSLVTGSDNIARYKISGSANYARLWARGSSSVYASNLETESCNVTSNTIGECHVRVNGTLSAQLNASGNVLYYGNPPDIIIVEESGDGRLLQAE